MGGIAATFSLVNHANWLWILWFSLAVFTKKTWYSHWRFWFSDHFKVVINLIIWGRDDKVFFKRLFQEKSKQYQAKKKSNIPLYLTWFNMNGLNLLLSCFQYKFYFFVLSYYKVVMYCCLFLMRGNHTLRHICKLSKNKPLIAYWNHIAG